MIKEFLNHAQLKLTLVFVLMSVQLFAQNDTDSNSNQQLNEVVLLGSRALPRVQTSSPVPVDVIDMKKISSDAPQMSLNSILNYTAPSFTSTPQTVADGTDHIDPASLRGMGPDQTLVLLNGKRRHTTSLVNVNGTMGRGAVGTDLNAIPSIALEKLEVLRDGAAAQYGSDAIAGVINLGLRKNNKGTQVRITSGINITSFEEYTNANKGDFTKDINPTYTKRDVVDGLNNQIAINHGLTLGQKGFLNLSAALDVRDNTTRAGERTGAINNKTVTGWNSDDDYLNAVGKTRNDYRMIVGQSTLKGGQAFANMGLKIDETTDFYVFGGYGIRQGTSAGNYRLPFDGIGRNLLSIYPNGFLPLINSTIKDASFAVGIKGSSADWHYDLSNTLGMNRFDFDISNSLNASSRLVSNYANGPIAGLDSTKNAFYAGGLRFIQNTTNFDLTKQYSVLEGLNVAAGGELRWEQYAQFSGEAGSWENFNRRMKSDLKNNINVVNTSGDTTLPNLLSSGAQGVPQGGSQVFPGFRPDAQFVKSRLSGALYLDLEQNFTKEFLVTAAMRIENYEDFGSNFSWKTTSRFKVAEWLNLRAGVNTGFRAPSLHQRFTLKTSSVTVAGVSTEQGTLPNDSKAAELLGIPKLRPEISMSASAGFTVNFNNFKFTTDAYVINVTDRIIFTDAFSGSSISSILLQNNASSGVFFANAIDTRNYGLDVVASYNLKLNGGHNVRFDLSGTFSEVQLVGDPKTSEILRPQTHVYLSPINKSLITSAFPRYKSNLLINYSNKNINVFLRNAFFGSAEHVEGTFDATSAAISGVSGKYFYAQTISSLILTDISFSYKINKNIKVTVGANNLFDIYPDVISASKGSFFKLQTDATKTNYNQIIETNRTAKDLGIQSNDGLITNNQFTYSRRVSMIGLNGRFVFLRAEFNF